MAGNRHPIDELSDVRGDIKRLKAREDELRDLILTGGCDLIGDQFSASITTSQQTRVDMDALREAIGAERVKAISKPISIRTIKLSEREMVVDE